MGNIHDSMLRSPCSQLLRYVSFFGLVLGGVYRWMLLKDLRDYLESSESKERILVFRNIFRNRDIETNHQRFPRTEIENLMVLLIQFSITMDLIEEHIAVTNLWFYLIGTARMDGILHHSIILSQLLYCF